MKKTINAHAKINLNLRIHRKRSDGFHELTTQMAPIELADIIEVEAAEGYQLHCDAPGVPTDESNLITKAVRLMEAEIGKELNYSIKLIKEIPHGAGLGGGSSDAAAILKYLNAAEGAPLDEAALHRIAAELGSDVPFFLHQCICSCTGRGESILPQPEMQPDLNLLLLKPHFGVSTSAAYARWESSKEIPSISYGVQQFEGIEFINDLERPVFEKHRFLAETKRWLMQRPETHVAMMSGSGSTMYCLLEKAEQADAVVTAAKAELDPHFWTWSGSLASNPHEPSLGE